MRTVTLPDADTLSAAGEVVRRFLSPTPITPASGLGADIVFKLETLQPTGSFKVRGGRAAVAAAQRDEPGVPMVAASAGNHGLGVAFAADRLGVEATVVVAETASPAKVRALEQFSVRLVRFGRSYDEAEARALELAAAGGRFLSPYNDPDVVAGQASLGEELASQVPNLATVILPVGGGGLISGVSLALATRGVRIVGVEPERSNAMTAAFRADGTPVVLESTMADGLAGSIEEGSITVDLVRRHVDDMATVSEAEMADAMRVLAFDHGLVVEASGSVGVAALRAGRIKPDQGGTTVVVLTGRNIAPDLLVRVLGG